MKKTEAKSKTETRYHNDPGIVVLEYLACLLCIVGTSLIAAVIESYYGYGASIFTFLGGVVLTIVLWKHLHISTSTD